MLTLDDVVILRQNGFSEFEIEKFNTQLQEKPQYVDLNSSHWQKVIEERRVYMEKKTREVAIRNNCSMSAAYAAVQKRIDTLYQKIAGMSLFTFLRSEYSKIREYKTDYMKALRSRQKAQEKVREVYK